MKKYILGAVVLVIILAIIDMTVLKENGMIGLADKYEKIENAEQVPIGIVEGKRAPDFELTDLNGDKVRLSEYKGMPVLLNFWASWCPPCKKEMPHMESIYKKYKDEFAILAVNVTTSEKKKEDVNKFIEEYKLTFPIPMDEKGEVFHQYEVMGYPTSFFIDSDGIIRRVVLGPVDEKELKTEIKKLP